ncbi:hypothetical protein D3C73_433360 [compost metagenome]
MFPTGLIIVATFVFFPLGLLLGIIRLIVHWNLPLRRIRDIRIGSSMCICFFFLIGIIIMFMITKEINRDFYLRAAIVDVIFIMLPAGVVFKISQHEELKLVKEYEAYRHLIVDLRLLTIAQIAEAMRKTPVKVMNDLKDMIRQKLLPEAILDPHSQVIVLIHDPGPQQAPLIDPQRRMEPSVQSPPSNDPTPIPRRVKPAKTVDCSGCGNKAQLAEDETKYCEYCGSRLKYV